MAKKYNCYHEVVDGRRACICLLSTDEGDVEGCDDGKRHDMSAGLEPKVAKSPTITTKRPSRSSRLRHRSFYVNTLLSVSISLARLRCCTLLRQLPTMVVLVDLDDDEPPREKNLLNVKPLHHSVTEEVKSVPVVDERPNPNINGFSAALSCYP
jgi:hypothetical protein